LASLDKFNLKKKKKKARGAEPAIDFTFQFHMSCVMPGAEPQYHQNINNELGLYPIENGLSKCNPL